MAIKLSEQQVSSQETALNQDSRDPSQRALRFLPKTCSKYGKGIGRKERISQRALGFSPNRV
jgi:hypothetical protein